MDEDRAAAAGDPRPGIVVDLDNEVVEAIVTAQPVARFLGRARERAVIAPVVRVFAPGVMWADAADRQRGARAGQAVGAPPQPQGVKPSARRAAVAFALVGFDAGAAERDGQRQWAGEQQALRGPARPGADADRGKRSPPQRFWPDSQGPLALVSCRSSRARRRGKAATGVKLPNTRKILIVDDDAELRDGLTEQLSLHEEFEAVGVESGSKGVQAAKAGQIDLVIMDVGLPDIDGREAVRILRKNGFKAPIIMLTGHDTDSDTILGLESGANDYVTKPFRFAVLLARIRAQLRQHEASEDAVFTIGPYTFRPSSKLLLNPKGNKVRLTEKETSILRYLYRAGQRPVSRETLLQEVWGYNSGVTTHTLETHIYRLRQKIEKDAAAPAILVTEAGGYKLVP